MSDTPKVAPALTPEEWENSPDLYDDFVRWDADGLPKIIAAANASLPDDDLRKITRARIAAQRHAIQTLEEDHGWDGGDLWDFLAALESYLPPES